MRITLLSTSMSHGGAENQVFLLAKSFKARGHDVQVLSLLPPEAFEAELADLGVPYRHLGMARRAPDPRALWRLAQAVRAHRSQVLHSHLIHANLVARFARPLLGVPVLINTAHNAIEAGPRLERFYRWTDRMATLTTNVSHDAVKRYLDVGLSRPGKIRYMPNGLDLARFARDPAVGATKRAELGVATSDFLWLAIGRLEEQKDYPNMLAAMVRAVAQRPDTRLLVVGVGPLQQALEQETEALGLSGAVRFLGIRRDVPALMSAANGYLMSSAWEGLPMVLLEASAASLPIAATDVGGNREVVLHGRSGHLTAARDPQALAEAMVDLMETPPSEREIMGEVGRQHVLGTYELEAVVDAWLALYQALLDRRTDT